MAEVSTADGLSTRISERDASALGELYDTLAPGLMGLLMRILSDRGEAEQVLDEVFRQLWEKPPAAASDHTSVSARLVVMAHAAAVERLRTRRAPASASASHPNGSLPQASSAWLPKPQDIAALDERRELLKRIMKQISGTQRQVLELAVFEGYTEAELAEKLGEPLGKVKTELRAAMRFLRHRVRAVLGTWSTSI